MKICGILHQRRNITRYKIQLICLGFQVAGILGVWELTRKDFEDVRLKYFKV
jgi:hypothetical protein